MNSETTASKFRNSVWELPSLNSLSCWILILGVSLLMVSGCGRHKEELENAKQQIEKLSSEVKRLTYEVAELKQEKSRLSDDLNSISGKNMLMQRELEDLNKAKTALSNENKEIRKKNSVAEEEIASLKNEKTLLVEEIEKHKKPATETAPSPSPIPAPPAPGLQSSRPIETLNPCEAIFAFMKASEAVVRQQAGAQRTKSLEQVKEQFAPRMKGAPARARKAAEDWVKEGTKFWDRSSDESTFRLLRLRNTVLESCGKSPSEAGF
jgi:uncharacterized protein YoxC